MSDSVALGRVADDLGFGAILETRQLSGGLGSAPTLVVFADRAIVVKRFTANPEAAMLEHRNLLSVLDAPVPTPAPLRLDVEGAWFGEPAIAMAWLDGSPAFPADPDPAWIDALAEALAAVHRPMRGVAPLWPMRLVEGLRAIGGTDPILDVALAVAEDLLASGDNDVVFAHGDFHPGNVLFCSGRLTGVVDWEDAGPRSRASDVAYCRGVLAIYPGGDTPDRFLRSYEAQTGAAVDCRRWDVLWAARGILGSRRRWPAALAALGVTVAASEIERRSRTWAALAIANLETH